jgi:OmpR family response regulator RpaB
MPRGLVIAACFAPPHNPPMPRILLIDDDEHLAAPLASYFARFGCTLDSAQRPSEGLARLREAVAPMLPAARGSLPPEREPAALGRPGNGGYDAAILDVMLPEMDGFALCRLIRAQPGFGDIPIVMLTARGEVMDRVVGLEMGADDYLPKPFEPRELVARVQTILRRQRVRPSPAPQAPPHAALLRFDGLSIDLDRRAVLRQGEPVELTSTEFELLALLAREPGKVFGRDDILNRLRGHEADLYTRAVDIVVSRLRRKLEPLACIKTLRNAGYTLAVAPAAQVP